MEANITSRTGSKVAYMAGIGKGESAQKNVLRECKRGFSHVHPPHTCMSKLICADFFLCFPFKHGPCRPLSNKPSIISTLYMYLALKTGEISLDIFDGLLNTSRRLSGIYGEK